MGKGKGKGKGKAVERKRLKAEIAYRAKTDDANFCIV